jgi:hypothetical protein
MKIFCQLISYKATLQHDCIEGMLAVGRIPFAVITKQHVKILRVCFVPTIGLHKEKQKLAS